LTTAPAVGATGGHNGRIAFVVDPGTGAEIRSVAADGSHMRTLVDYRHAVVESPAWSPHGYHLVFSKMDDSGCHIVLARPDGTHRRDLTGDRRGCESTPTFGPAGKRIVFAVQRCDRCRTWISGMDLTGHHRHRILRVARQTTPEDVVVSPDGRSIAFESTYDPDLKPFNRAIFTARRNGTHLHTLVPYRYDAGVHFDWSSGGRWLIYTRWSESPNGHNANVFLISPNGSHQKRLTSVHPTGLSAGGATFSPDGRKVVYRFADADRGLNWISTMRVDGSHNTRIRKLTPPPQGTAWAPQIG
jgi:Tol biopolymer transport system component